MSRILVLAFLLFSISSKDNTEQVISRQGNVSFFSYTSVENIKAENNQVLSIIDIDKSTIGVRMLMNSFVFEKALMKEHFNESYIESDIYPEATFEGRILDFDPKKEGEQVRMIKGDFSMHGVTKELEIKTKILYQNGKYMLTGTFETNVKDYNIKIPPLLAGNIAKSIEVSFKFEYEPYENK